MSKVKKPTLKERVEKAYNDGVQSGLRTADITTRKRIAAVAERRRLAFYTYQGAMNAVAIVSLKTLAETLDRLDREVYST